MHKYSCYYNDQEVFVYAASSYAACLQAIDHFKPAKSKRHMVHVGLCELNAAPGQPGEQVVHSPLF